MTTKRIFVSHSHTDASFCQALVLSLQGQRTLKQRE